MSWSRSKRSRDTEKVRENPVQEMLRTGSAAVEVDAGVKALFEKEFQTHDINLCEGAGVDKWIRCSEA
jgi:hypothetical protein